MATSSSSSTRLSHLSGGPMDLIYLREEARRSLLDLLNRFPGRKVLVLDSSLAAPLGLIVEVTDLKEHGVESWFELGPYDLQTDTPTVIFICRPDLKLMANIARQVRSVENHQKTTTATSMLGLTSTSSRGGGSIGLGGGGGGGGGRSPTCIVVFVPQQTECCVQALRNQNVHVILASYPLYFVPFDKDLLSLELRGTFRDFHLYGDPSSLLYAAKALVFLQSVCGGPVPNVRAIGSAARYVAELLVRFRREQSADLLAANLQNQQGGGESFMGSAGDDGRGGVSSLFNASPPLAVVSAATAAVPPVRFVLASAAGQENQHIAMGHEANYNPTSTTEEIDKEKATAAVGGAEGLSSSVPLKDKSSSTSRSSGNSSGGGGCCIDYLVLIDRRADMVSPLCSPFTYEALLDATFGIHCTYLEVPTVLLQSSNAGGGGADVSSFGGAGGGGGEGRKTKIALNSSDVLFTHLRDLHQSHLGPYLHKKANEIQETYKQKDELKSITEINDFMKKFKVKQQEHTSLATHVNLASYLSKITKDEEYHKRLQLEDEIIQSAGGGGAVGSSVNHLVAALEELIDSRVPVTDVYRLLCLMSLVSNGIQSKSLDGLRRSFVQQYGYEELQRIANLDTVGLLRPQQGRSQWDQIKKHFNLLVDESQAMKDISYVCSGYAPLSVRLLQLLHSLPGGWRSCPEALNLLWGPALEIRQQPLYGAQGSGGGGSRMNRGLVTSDSAAVASGSTGGKKGLAASGGRQEERPMMRGGEEGGKPTVVLVLYLGGVTFAEVAAIRKLSEIENHARRYIIATTEFLSATKWLDGFQDLHATTGTNGVHGGGGGGGV